MLSISCLFLYGQEPKVHRGHPANNKKGAKLKLDWAGQPDIATVNFPGH
jgi:hypothetical protein